MQSLFKLQACDVIMIFGQRTKPFPRNVYIDEGGGPPARGTHSRRQFFFFCRRLGGGGGGGCRSGRVGSVRVGSLLSFRMGGLNMTDLINTLVYFAL